MLPKDLASLTVEQLRGFAIAVNERIAELKADANADPAKLAALEAALDDRDRLTSAIHAAVDASADDSPADAPADEADASDGDDEGDDADADADAAVDDAVAAMTLGGGTAPRVTRDEGDKLDPAAMRKFVRHMVQGGGNVTQAEHHSFATMRRATNHKVAKGGDANEKIRLAIADRKAGTDNTAAGCFCGPDDAITAIKQCGETVRPLSDTLPTITATGDVRYIRQISLADALTGVTQWTCTDQGEVSETDPATWKPCFDLDCEAEQTSALYAVNGCARFDTQQQIGNPDLIDNLEHVMQVAFNKTAELLVYQRIKALSSQYDWTLLATTGYGASAQLLAAVGWWQELVKASLREGSPNYTLALPAGVFERVITDGVIRGFDEYRVRADLYDRLATLGVDNVVELVDEITGVPAPLAHAVPVAPGGPIVPAPAHPLVQEILLYRPEDFLLGVGPDLDFGITRSPELARQNKLQWQLESFEFVEKVGCAPAGVLQVPLCPSGIRPALGTGEDCVIVL